MRPVEQQTTEEINLYLEEFLLILQDLLALPASSPILAEGAALLPECVAPLLLNPANAIWLTPTPEFQLNYYSQRKWAKEVVKDCTDPAQAFTNWMQRDMRFATHIAQQAAHHQLQHILVDGKLSLAENILLVEQHFQAEFNHS